MWTIYLYFIYLLVLCVATTATSFAALTAASHITTTATDTTIQFWGEIGTFKKCLQNAMRQQCVFDIKNSGRFSTFLFSHGTKWNSKHTHIHLPNESYWIKVKWWQWAAPTEASEHAVWSPVGPPVTSDQLHTFHSAPVWPYMEHRDKITAMEPCIHLLFLDDMSDGS